MVLRAQVGRSRRGHRGWESDNVQASMRWAMRIASLKVLGPWFWARRVMSGHKRGHKKKSLTCSGMVGSAWTRVDLGEHQIGLLVHALVVETSRVVAMPSRPNFDGRSFARGDPGGSPNSPSLRWLVVRTKWRRHFRARCELPKPCARQTICGNLRSSQSDPTMLRRPQRASRRRTLGEP